MRGRMYSTDEQLLDKDMEELVDELALRLYTSMGPKVYLLDRGDITHLVAQYIDDLHPKDQEAVPWFLWDLFQEGMALQFG